jgi:competence protein ComEA
MNQHIRRIASAVLLLAFSLALPALAAEGKTEGKRVVNINSADASQLAYLPRVGPSLAQKIIEFRKKSPFKSAEDLMLVPGIGEKTFQLLRPYLAVSGESTLKEKVHGEKPARSKEGAR